MTKYCILIIDNQVLLSKDSATAGIKGIAGVKAKVGRLLGGADDD
jgi:hypothetical protein